MRIGIIIILTCLAVAAPSADKMTKIPVLSFSDSGVPG